MKLKSAGASSLWQQYHSNMDTRKVLPPLVASGWARSDHSHIDYINTMPPVLSAEEIRTTKKAFRLFSVSSINPIRKLLQDLDGLDIGALLFSPEGHLYYLCGKERFLAQAEETGICAGTSWSEKNIGTNIFSVGIQRKTATFLRGEENYPKFLTGFDYYFSPVQLNQTGQGGVALVCPHALPHQLMLSIISLLAMNIELQMFWLNSTHTQNFSQGTVIVLDQSTGQNRIVSSDHNLHKLFNISAHSIFYDNLDTIFHKDPYNKELWNIVTKKKTVSNERMQLIAKSGISITAIVSSRLFFAPQLNLSGITLSIQVDSVKTPSRKAQSENSAKNTFQSIITGNSRMKKIIEHSKAAAQTDSSILLLGESGVGKEVFAQAIHNASNRCNGPFIALNCAAFPKDLISSEFFGYEGGAFSGGKREGQIGKLQLADGGTLFLDEIGDMPINLQAVLLRALEEKSFRRVGGNALQSVNVRIIAATNKNLAEHVRLGEFRQDLYYRLGVIQIVIPPLRERGNDVLTLAEYFIQHLCRQLHRDVPKLTRSAKLCIQNYYWPGNVRELRNVMESTLCTHSDSEITERTLVDYMTSQKIFDPLQQNSTSLFSNQENSRKKYDKFEIEHALANANGHRDKAAYHLGISRTTLYRYMKRFDLL